jgi:hypothetical protein
MAAIPTIAALACAAHFLNPHPHMVSNAQDAIATAYTDWQATVAPGPDDKREFENWKRIYSAKQTGSIWVLSPNVPGSTYKGEGTHITLDAKIGCIVSETSFD